MMNECEKNAGLMMRIASPDSVRNRRFAVSSEIPRHVLFASCRGKKNGMWGLREDSANVLRSQGPACTMYPVATLGCTWSSRSGPCPAGAAAP